MHKIDKISSDGASNIRRASSSVGPPWEQASVHKETSCLDAVGAKPLLPPDLAWNDSDGMDGSLDVQVSDLTLTWVFITWPDRSLT